MSTAAESFSITAALAAFHDRARAGAARVVVYQRFGLVVIGGFIAVGLAGALGVRASICIPILAALQVLSQATLGGQIPALLWARALDETPEPEPAKESPP